MTQETAERLLGSLIVAIVVVVMLFIGLWVATTTSRDEGVFGIVQLLVALLVVGAATIVWALFHHELASVLFRPSQRAVSTQSDLQLIASPGVRTPWLYQSPRWLLPGAGAFLMLTLFALAAIGAISVSLAFTVMALIAFGGLAAGLLLPESEEEDRRADLPLTLFLLWAVLYLLRTGLFFEIVAALSWPGFIFGALYVYWHDHPRWWIVAGFPLLVLYNLTIFFAFFRA